MASISATRALPRALRQTVRPQSFRRIATGSTAVEHFEPDGYVPDTTLPSSTTTPVDRKATIRDAQPFSEFLTDNYHRQHDYLRISVTEKCNLRCLYCMPEEGIDLSPPKTQLTTPEIHYLSALFVNQGVTKIRLTGGEPTVRKDIVPLMQQIGSLRRNGLKELALTTNAISLHRKLDAMVEAGLTGVNISLDTLDPFEFQLLTRRQGFEAVMKSINRVQEMNKVGAGIKLKINAVVMRGLNSHQVLPFVEMTRDQDIEVRFIEYMPFGGNKWSENKMVPYAEMLDMIREKYPTLARMRDAKNDTSKTWHIAGFKGRIGFITSMTHNFCGTCNRLRITSDGNLKVCLHGNAEVSLRDLLREHNDGEPMDQEAFEAVRQIEKHRINRQTFAFDGEEGWMTQESRLLNVIGAAVKRKKERHAGMGELEKMTNRPMILIGEQARYVATSGPRSRRQQLSQGQTTMLLRPAVPLHLLSPSSRVNQQVRCYSSDTKSPPDDQEESKEAPKSEGFGFQSLSSLFHQPLGGRYSRGRAAVVKQELNVAETSPEQSVAPTEEKAESSAHPPRNKFFQSFWTPTQPADPNAVAAPVTSFFDGMGESARRTEQQDPPLSAVNLSGLDAVMASQEAPRLKPSGRYSSRRPRVPNPFAPSSQEGQRPTSLAKVTKSSSWGSQAEDSDSPSYYRTHAVGRPSPMSTPRRLRRTAAQPRLERGQPQALTHLSPSGSARMVDVAAKPATQRIAIAHALVRFSNTTSHQLIAASQNAKGDVLAVARIAGIMAAKRCADLIPLCHPLPLTRVDMDVTSHPPGTTAEAARLWPAQDNAHGVVAITARVECVGPTGVEMEALTAASVAALTVYDMCKAVDQAIVVEGTRLLYKSGGRRGVYVSRQSVGREWLERNGLEDA